MLHPLTTTVRAPMARQPITSQDAALDLFAVAVDRPLVAETLGVLLDDSNRGSVITIVSGTDRPESVLDVAECLALAASDSPELSALLLATVRPASMTIPGDIDRWYELQALTELHGIELIEWFIIGPAGAECPRELAGEPQRF